MLLGQVEQVARRLRKHGLRARSVHLKIRDGAFRTVTRATTLREPTDSTKALWDVARATFDEWARASFKPVRLIGMSASGLTREPEQLGLFVDRAGERQKRVDNVLDAINTKFGKTAIRRAFRSPLPPGEG